MAYSGAGGQKIVETHQVKYKTRDMNWLSLEPFTYNDMQNVWLDADREEGRSEQEPHRRKVD